MKKISDGREVREKNFHVWSEEQVSIVKGVFMDEFFSV